MKQTTEVTASPNRRNIRLGLTRVHAQKLNCMDWVVKEVKDKGLSMPPIIIYCRHKKIVGKVFCYLKAELGEDAWVGTEDSSSDS